MSFGYGEAICPSCYDGEYNFIFLDKSYWLNRLLSRNIEQNMFHKKREDYDEILLERMMAAEDHQIIFQDK